MKIPSNNKILFAVVLCLIVLNIFGFRLVRNYVDLIAESRLELATEDVLTQIKNRLHSYHHILNGSSALFSASNEVTKDEWIKYVQGLNLSEDYPGIQVLGYAPYLTPEMIGGFESNLHRLGVDNYKIFPEESTDYTVPVLYLYPPSEEVSKVVGFNMVTDPIRNAAIQKAIENDDISVSGKLIPLIDKAKNLSGVGVAMYHPVYKKGIDLNNATERKNNITGFIVAGVRPVELMQGLTLKAAPGVHFQVFDDSSNGELSENSLLYNSGGDELLEPGFIPRFTSKKVISFPNTNWYVRFSVLPDNQLSDFFRYTPYLVLAFNLILSILFFLFVKKMLVLYRNANRLSLIYAERLVYEDAIIDSDEEGIIMTDPYGLITVFNKKAEQVLGYTEREAQHRMDFLNLVSKDELASKVLDLQKRTGVAVKHNFDAIITDCLLDGKEHCQWGLINKSGQPRTTDMVIRPVYDSSNQLLGYKFTF